MPWASDDFEFGGLLAEAVAQEGDEQEDREQEDHEHADPGNMDDAPLLPPRPDPFDEVDDLPPLVPSPPAPSRPEKRRRTAFNDMVDGKKPQTRSHRNRKEKRQKSIKEDGHKPRASTKSKYVASAQPVQTGLNTADLPAAHGAYVAKVEDKRGEKYGSKQRRTLGDLVRLGINILPWNG